MATIDDACDYLIASADEAGVYLDLLKLQKLLYYAQAWHLALNDTPLFDGDFQAWIHGPVSRHIYDRFNENKSLYSRVTRADMRPGYLAKSLTTEERVHLDDIMAEYGRLSGSQLEDLSHREDPWLIARGDLDPAERCETPLSEETMKTFYRARIRA